MRVAVAQTVPVAGNLHQNLIAHLTLATQAAERGAQLLAFPELSLTGYELARARSLAFREVDDPRIDPLRALADRRKMTLVVGAPIKLAEGLHLGAFVIGPRDRLDVYTKRHLGAFSAADGPGGRVPPPEDSVFVAGARDPLIEAGGQRACVAICRDSTQPSHAAAAAERGASIYLASAFVIESDYAADAARLSGYAKQHSMLVGLANFGGPSGGLASAGRSAVFSETGERVAAVAGQGPGLAMAERDDAGGWRGI